MFIVISHWNKSSLQNQYVNREWVGVNVLRYLRSSSYTCLSLGATKTYRIFRAAVKSNDEKSHISRTRK